MRLRLVAVLLPAGLVLAGGGARGDGDPTRDDDDEAPSKKAALLAEKAGRAPVRREAAPPPRLPAAPVSLVNLWTHEVLPVDADRPPPRDAVDEFLRCHYTNQRAAMDARLVATLVDAARRFSRSVVEVVSGYRAHKYNLLLRKKGHEVARDSEHPRGQAVDFRLPGLATRTLLRWVRGLRLGGVGHYPRSAFVHADVGRVRFWKGR